MAAHLGDIIWVTGAVVVALGCLRYAREAKRDHDGALVVVAGFAAAVFAAAALTYVWWLW